MPEHDAPSERLPVGEIAGAHGVRGLLRVRTYNDTSELLASLGVIELADEAGQVETRRVVRAAPHGRGVWLVELEGVADRTTAEAFAGRRIVVAPEALPPLESGEFYHHELEGFVVETTAGTPIGRIERTFSTGLNDVWVVRDGPREHLVPAIADVVDTIDRAGRRVVIVPMDGLLD